VQEDGLNVSPVLPSLQDTVPVGVVGDVEVSLVEAVNVIDPVAETVPGLGVIVKVVEWGVFTEVELIRADAVEVLEELALDEELDVLFSFDVFALDEDELFDVDDDDVNTVEPEVEYWGDCRDSIDTLEEEDDEYAFELSTPLEVCAELDADEELPVKE